MHVYGCALITTRSKEIDMYGHHISIQGPFAPALDKVTAALKVEGFGVLSDIDIQKAMQEKLGVAMPAYRILGACNPPLAHRALQADPEVGLLLPCNVTVRELPDGKVGGRVPGSADDGPAYERRRHPFCRRRRGTAPGAGAARARERRLITNAF
jgi:uncharacterized protein (DUF302 family)